MATLTMNVHAVQMDNKQAVSTETFCVVHPPKEVQLTEEEEMAKTLKRSSKQPPNIGFGFVLHFPAFNLNAVDQGTLERLAVKGMRLESAQPLWIRTKQPYYKATFKYGDVQTAKEALALFTEVIGIVYKNWK